MSIIPKLFRLECMRFQGYCAQWQDEELSFWRWPLAPTGMYAVEWVYGDDSVPQKTVPKNTA